MKVQLKVVAVLGQRTFKSANGQDVVAVPLLLEQGRDQFVADAVGFMKHSHEANLRKPQYLLRKHEIDLMLPYTIIS